MQRVKCDYTFIEKNKIMSVESVCIPRKYECIASPEKNKKQKIVFNTNWDRINVNFLDFCIFASKEKSQTES